jgi:hypothetical protein
MSVLDEMLAKSSNSFLENPFKSCRTLGR